jgi:hypothetical protein
METSKANTKGNERGPANWNMQSTENVTGRDKEEITDELINCIYI